MTSIRNALRRRMTSILVAVIVIVAAGWLTLVGAHDPAGAYGESAAAWAQAIMSVGAILVAVVIDQGASRRDRQTRQEAATEARAARIGVLRLCANALDNAAAAAATRPLRRGYRFEGLAVEALLSAQQTARHFANRGSDTDALLVWILNRAASEIDAAAAVLVGHRLTTAADLRDLQQAARKRAQGLRELLDEYEAGIHDY